MAYKDIPKEIRSVSSFIDAIFKLKCEKAAELSNGSYWFFRGQKSSIWSMRPNVFRQKMLNFEYSTIQDAIRQRPYEFRECQSDFEILTKLQHYGLGTRLLDVTLNPLVALYFATEPCKEMVYGKNGQGKEILRDGKVVFQYGYGHKVNELDVSIGCALPFVEFYNGLTLGDLCNFFQEHGVISAEQYNFLKAKDYKKFVEIIQKNSFVISSHSNDRLVQQSGAFIVPTAIKIVHTEGSIGDSIVRKAICDLDSEFDNHCFIIPHKYKDQIRDELDFLNINEATLFPEFEHQLLYLKSKKSVVEDDPEYYVPFMQKGTAESSIEEPEPEVDTEPSPNVAKIINEILIGVPQSQEKVQRIISEGLLNVDWWLKDTILSQIKRDITRELQTSQSMVTSKKLANKIVDCLTSPGEEYRLRKK